MILTIGDRLKAAGKTDVGSYRSLNEDNLFIDEELGLLLVADGMGGHEAGEVASSQTITSIRQSLAEAMRTPPRMMQNAPPQQEESLGGDDDPTEDDIPNPVISMLRNAANSANAAINAANRMNKMDEGTGMGSTVVGLWLPKFSDVPVVFHVGDSRLYHLRDGAMAQVTQDHSMYQRWLNLGKKGPEPAHNILLQAIGPSEFIIPDIHFKEMRKGDTVLLCSDGLSGMATNEAIQKIVATAKPDNLDEVVDKLVDLAILGGGKDNITVIVGHFIK